MRVSTIVTVLLAAAAPALAKHKKGKKHHGHKPTGQCTEEPTATQTSSSSGEPTETGAPAECEGNCYQESANYVGKDWLNGDWNFFDSRDPTHGRVKYVDADRAKDKNLTYANEESGSFILRVDTSSKLSSDGAGRESVRIESKKYYETHVSVIDVRHMPAGAGTWPAFWMVGNDWPNQGELDIIEGQNDDPQNTMSLHTSDDCTQPDSGRKMSGKVGHSNCFAFTNDNKGCGVQDASEVSFGPGFNKNGGGYYATERTDKRIAVWFWPRDADNVPEDVRKNTGAVAPEKWGEPTAKFVSDSCDLSQKFKGNQFVINTTLCGDWAGNAFDGGLKKCDQLVNENPEAFNDAYWDIQRMTVYEH